MHQETMLDELVVLTTLRRQAHDEAEVERQRAQSVELARRAGWSWDRIGRELHVPGETLRRQASLRRAG